MTEPYRRYVIWASTAGVSESIRGMFPEIFLLSRAIQAAPDDFGNYLDWDFLKEVHWRELDAILVCGGTISQLFRREMGISFSRCVIQRRLSEAKNLITPGMLMEQAGLAMGFQDYSSFYRAFKQEMGDYMKAYAICDGCGTKAVILPEKGATVISLTRNGEEFLYCDQENLESAERPRCGIPFLFPIFGRLKDGQYTYEGNTYSMEIHGFAHTSVWQVAEYTGDSLRLTLEANKETMAVYPFRFQVELYFRVAEGVLTIHQRYQNFDKKPMPYNFGFHPYFRVDALEHANVETTASFLFDYSVGKPVPFGHGMAGISIPEGAAESGAAFMEVKAPTALHIPQEYRKITMEYDENFPQLILWTQTGKSFLCVEPINGTPNGLNTGEYFTLEPGAEKVTSLCIRADIT